MATGLPWTFGVVTPQLKNGTIRAWDPRIRPLPANVITYTSCEDALGRSSWDWILTHNVQDLLDVRCSRLPKVFLIHGTLSGRIVQDESAIDRKAYVENLRKLLRADHCRVVYISSLKREDWGIPGDVIPSAIDAREYGGYRGEKRGILQVSNHLKQRGAMLGWAAHKEVCRDLPNLVLGRNPGLAESRRASDWEDLKEQYRSFRVYLHTAVYPYEDGFNLATLEAMATGMPIAGIDHPTSPVEDGVDGVLAGDATTLRSKVLRLLENPDLAANLGKNAREKVEKIFPWEAFRGAWESLAKSVG